MCFITLHILGTAGEIVQKVISKYVDLSKLNATEMLPRLYAKGVITRDEKKVSQTKSLESEKMMYLLDDIIIPSLEAGLTVKYERFLEVMEATENKTTMFIAQQLRMLIGVKVANTFPPLSYAVS